jgi:uncharacterized protein DUF882
MRRIHWSSYPRPSAIAKGTFLGALLIALFLALFLPTEDRGLRAEVFKKSDVSAPAVEAVTVPSKASPETGLVPAALLGKSGSLRAIMETQDQLETDASLRNLVEDSSNGPASAGWTKLVTPLGDPFTVVTLVPFNEAGTAGFSRYRVGSWPSSALTATPRYAPPKGFIGVTPENQGTAVSSNFTMSDFLTHDQTNVWPKVLVLRPVLLDKLELIHQELEREGLPSRLHVMSGFRTPQYNEQGVGKKGGRAAHSRHMYGDAADVFVDADGNGRMDDLNKDGRITVADARVLRSAAEKVEAQYPDLVGGLSAYPANSAHGPFVHVDARGVKARW